MANAQATQHLSYEFESELQETEQSPASVLVLCGGEWSFLPPGERARGRGRSNPDFRRIRPGYYRAVSAFSSFLVIAFRFRREFD